MSQEMVREEQQSYEITDLENKGGALATITKAEIDTQISTAHQYPRSLTQFAKKSMAMLSMNKEVADECFYVIPRGGKTIEGPSVRLAEIVAACYGNMRCGARVVAEEGEFIVAQGVCHDLENNTAITMEVKRRITDSRGNRYNSDMVGVTGNAAASIAFRNTVFRVVPKVLWLPLYEEARKVAKGDAKTFEVKREAVLQAFEKLKVPRKKIFDYLEIKGIEDLTSDHLVTLVGIGNAIKNGEATIADLDVKQEPSVPQRMSDKPAATAGGATQAPQQETKEEQKNTPATASAPATPGMFESGEADPYITPAEINDFWSAVFKLELKKSAVAALLQEKFNVSQLKDLRKSQLGAALEAIQAKAKK